jgi:hypothetical protein
MAHFGYGGFFRLTPKNKIIMQSIIIFSETLKLCFWGFGCPNVPLTFIPYFLNFPYPNVFLTFSPSNFRLIATACKAIRTTLLS